MDKEVDLLAGLYKDADEYTQYKILEKIYLKYREYLFSVSVVFTYAVQDKEDLFQELCYYLIKAIKLFDNSYGVYFQRFFHKWILKAVSMWFRSAPSVKLAARDRQALQKIVSLNRPKSPTDSREKIYDLKKSDEQYEHKLMSVASQFLSPAEQKTLRIELMAYDTETNDRNDFIRHVTGHSRQAHENKMKVIKRKLLHKKAILYTLMGD